MKTIHKLFATVALAFLAASRLHAETVIADTVADFSLAAQGTNGFEYGVYNEPDARVGTFSTAGFVVTATYWNGQEGAGTPGVDMNGQHPAYLSLRPAVRRYTVGSSGEPVPADGMMRIVGQFYGTSGFRVV